MAKQKVKMTKTDTIAGWLIVIGGITWGLEALGNFFKVTLNPVEILAGAVRYSPLVNIVYGIVGIATVYFIFRIFKGFK